MRLSVKPVFEPILGASRRELVPQLQSTNLSCSQDIEVDPLNWSIIEPCVGIICACLSTLRPLFRFLFRSGSTRAVSKPKSSSWLSPQRQRGTLRSIDKSKDSKHEHPGDLQWSLRHQQQRLGSEDGRMATSPSQGLAANGVEMGRIELAEVDEEGFGHHTNYAV